MIKKALIVLVLLLLPMFVSAQGAQGQITYIPLEPLPGLEQAQKGTDFAAFLSGFFTLLITIGGIVAVGALVLGGFVYMTSEVVGKKDEARKRLQKAVWGLLILIASYLVLNTINPQLLEFKFLPGQAGRQSAPPPGARTPSQPAGTPTQADVDDCQDVGKTLIPQPGGWRCG